MKGVGLILNYLLFFALLFVATGAYQTAAVKWGWLGGGISVVLAFGLPLLTFKLWTQVYDNRAKAKKEPTISAKDQQRTASAYRTVYLNQLAALMAKMAQADGTVDEREIRESGHIFEKLHFTTREIDICVQAFCDVLSTSPSGSHSARFYATQMVLSGIGVELRRITYEILWDIACADGRLASSEKALLIELETALELPAGTFHYFYTRRVRQHTQGGQTKPPPAQSDGYLSEAYTVLGCSPNSSDDQLRQAYREMAKKLHPDVLRSQGMPEALMSKANERMARINVAWEQIKKARNLGV